MYKLYRVNTTIRFIAEFATEKELYTYCKRRHWLSSLDRLEARTVSIMEYPDGFECEVWEDTDGFFAD